MSLRRLFSIVLKELRQLRRDRLTFAMIVGIPTMQLLLFGFAINLDVRHLDAAVLDQAGTMRSRELVAELAASQVLTLREALSSPQQLDEALRQGRISVGLVIPADFENRLERGDRPAVQLVVDGSDQVVQQAARQLAAYPLAHLRGQSAATASMEVVNFYNPERRAPVNTVPGLVGVILTMTMVMFTAMALVRERERGNLEMLIATPVSPWELTVGKVLPFVGIGLVQVSLVLALGKLIFAVPLRGSLLDVYLAALLFIIACLALGVFLSTLARSQFQAMQLAFFTFLPQILLSGFMFPYAGMPRAAQWLAEILPMTHFLRLIRGIALRGATLADLWIELVALAVFSALMLGIAVTRVHKRLD
ncbi:MAG: ABC transporter [Lysobacterales bacterium 69-70]|nr:ABC transporter permease [Xanthomonadaceae bacterium]ODU34324.1 MAG: ABC transporter [Xanthomonadaceae bacterium SCN 69-320]ODV22433.1 MAG: ABC transporter [Xanthomonadaceae bacterium SCN 69-25]OJY96230.1 MAG: ABC transporter [Xanthomonadales bacterium 69-70]